MKTKKPYSYWEKDFWQQRFDVCIIGAGFVGTSCAFHLSNIQKKWKILLVEQEQWGHGASSKNAGFGCFGTIGEIQNNILQHGLKKTIQITKNRYNGLQSLSKLIEPSAMDWAQTGAYEVFFSKEDFEQTEAFVHPINQWMKEIIGKEVFNIKKIDLGNTYTYGIYNPWEYQLHPMKAIRYLQNLSMRNQVSKMANCVIENIDHSDDYFTLVNKDKIAFEAKRIVYTTNAFTRKLLSNIEIYPARNQVLITEKMNNQMIDYNVHYDKGYVYMRNVGNRILIGGARNISQNEDSWEYGNSDEIMVHLKKLLQSFIPIGKEIKIAHQWSGIIGIGSSLEAFLGPISNRQFAAGRLNGMGVAYGHIVGKKLANLVCES